MFCYVLQLQPWRLPSRCGRGGTGAAMAARVGGDRGSFLAVRGEISYGVLPLHEPASSAIIWDPRYPFCVAVSRLGAALEEPHRERHHDDQDADEPRYGDPALVTDLGIPGQEATDRIDRERKRLVLREPL